MGATGMFIKSFFKNSKTKEKIGGEKKKSWKLWRRASKVDENLQGSRHEKGKKHSSNFGSSLKDWYSGWKCMKILATKGVVAKSSYPARLIAKGTDFVPIQELTYPAEACELPCVAIGHEKGKKHSSSFRSSLKDCYGGWKCMKILVTKGLVTKSSYPARLIAKGTDFVHIQELTYPAEPCELPCVAIGYTVWKCMKTLVTKIIAKGTEFLPPSPEEVHPEHVQLTEELEGFMDKYSSMCRLFSYQELLSATSNFQSENIIGRGGTCKVFRGRLPDGTEVAVKMMNSSKNVLKQYVSEIEIISTLNHKNVISLVGFCCEDNKFLLVYNLLSRGSLEENLHGTQKSGCSFGWTERYKAAIGVAGALDHLHNDNGVPIIHRDVKSANVLLSDDFEPQLSDFGLAMSASASSDCDVVAGTFSYLAPECFVHGGFDEKVDVYAFGVLLLELLSGTKPIDKRYPNGLVMWAKQILRDGKFSELLDKDLRESYDDEQFKNMVLAASLCIRRAPDDRPEMSTVVKLLQGEPDVVNWAEQYSSEEIEDWAEKYSSEEIEDWAEQYSSEEIEEPLELIRSSLDLALLDDDHYRVVACPLRRYSL